MTKVPKVKECAFSAHYFNKIVPRAHTTTLDHFRSLHILGTSGLLDWQAQPTLSDLALRTGFLKPNKNTAMDSSFPS